jgi:O-antigen/teichoic acid export membrane protein
VNFHPETGPDIQFLIGQYHTACLFPLLLTTVGAMAASTGMPYLSRDWESGDRESVHRHLNAMLKAMGLLCLAASVLILFLAPVLFGAIWQDKFLLGESLLPITLCFCSMAAMSVVAQNYFWCLEKTWIGSGLLLIGLTVNFGFGLALIADFGLAGVASSTLIAHAVVLASVLVLCVLQGLKWDRGVYVVCLALLSIGLGKLAAIAALVVVAGLVWRTSLLLDAEAKRLVFGKVAALRRGASRSAGSV